MIITCPSCNKKFKIDDTLITSEGRNLQCGSCNHYWFYTIENKTTESIKLEEDVKEKLIEPIKDNLSNSGNSKPSKTKLDQEIDKENIIQNINLAKKSRNITFNKFLSYLIVLIISFVVLVILIDTLKTPLIEIFPGLELLLFNLFETLQDIKLFIIDLS